MGHRLIQINAPEEEYGIELDREEMRRLTIGHEEEKFAHDGFQKLDSQSLGNPNPSGGGSGFGPDGTTSYSDDSTLTTAGSPACQRTLVLLGILLLLGTCLLFTLVNLSNKTYDDWIEPNRDAYLNEGK